MKEVKVSWLDLAEKANRNARNEVPGSSVARIR